MCLISRSCGSIVFVWEDVWEYHPLFSSNLPQSTLQRILFIRDWHWGHLNFHDHSEVYRWLRCNRQIQKKNSLHNSIFLGFGNGHFLKFAFSCSMVFPILGRLWIYTNCLSRVNLLRWALPCACTLHPSQTGLVQFGGPRSVIQWDPQLSSWSDPGDFPCTLTKVYMEPLTLQVWKMLFRISFPNNWFSGSMLIFQGVNNVLLKHVKTFLVMEISLISMGFVLQLCEWFVICLTIGEPKIATMFGKHLVRMSICRRT